MKSCGGFCRDFRKKRLPLFLWILRRKKRVAHFLGDRIRMNSIHSPRAYMRSLATRETDVALSAYVQEATGYLP